MQENERRKTTTLAVNTGLAANIVLACLKTAIGVVGHSPALLADGINSTSDVAYYVVVRIFMFFSNKPADSEHPYGHRQLESIAALVVGSFVVTTGIAIFWDSINKAYDVWTGESAFAGAEIAALWVALATVCAKIALTVYTKKVGVSTNSPTIMALAHDHRNDVLSAGGAAVGIALGRAGLPMGDPLVGAIVALLVLRTGIEILRDSSAHLMDAVPGAALEKQTREVLKSVRNILEIEEIQAHRFGPYFVMNVTIGIDGSMTVTEGDAIASEVENALCSQLDGVQRAYVHYHPASRKVSER